MDGKQGSCDLSTKQTTRMIAMCFKAEEKLWHENNNKMASTNNNVCIHFSNRSFSLCLSLYTRTQARLRSPSKTSILSPTIYGRMDVAAAVARLLCAPNACWQQNNSQQLEESLNKWIAFERRPIRNSKYNLFPFEKESNFYHINTNAHTHTPTHSNTHFIWKWIYSSWLRFRCIAYGRGFARVINLQFLMWYN